MINFLFKCNSKSLHIYIFKTTWKSYFKNNKRISGNLLKNLEKSWKYHGILSVLKSGNPAGIVTLSTDDIKYPHWHPQPRRKTPGPDVPQPYATPKETDAAIHDTKLNKELGLDKVFDLLALGEASPTPGPKTPAYGEVSTTIPPISLPTTGGSGDPGIGGLACGMVSPVTKRDDRLLDGLPPGSPMEVGLS